MEIIKVKDNQVVERNISRQKVEREIIALYPNTSFKRPLSDAFLTEHGYFFLQPTQRPAGDVATEGTPVPQSDGTWHQAWDVREFSAEERAEKFEMAKQDALARLNADYEAAMRPLTRTYPEIERESWDQQKTEASAYQAWLDAGSQGDAPATPVLDRILAGRNGADGTETIAELVGKVLKNVEAFVASQELTGCRHRGERLILAAETAEEARAVTWESLAG